MEKALPRLAVLLAFLLLAGAAGAQTVYSQPIVGYTVREFSVGNNLFENTLIHGSDSLTDLFSQWVPDGTTISLWNPSLSAFDTTSTYSGGSWTINLLLAPGTGAELYAPSAFTNIFTGTVVAHDGSGLTNANYIPLPPEFSGPDGTYLLGDATPLVDTDTNIFQNILGRMPNVGEQVSTLSGTSTYLGDGNWDNVPVLNVGDAAFLTVISVPEPGASSLLALGILLVGWRWRLNARHQESKTRSA